MAHPDKKTFVLSLASMGILSLSNPNMPQTIAATNWRGPDSAQPQPTEIQNWRAQNTERSAEQSFSAINSRAEEMNSTIRNSDNIKIRTWAEKPTKIYSLEELSAQQDTLFTTAKTEMQSGQTDQTMYNILNSLNFYTAAKTAEKLLALPEPEVGKHYDYCTIQQLNLTSSSAKDSAGQSNGDQPETLATSQELRTISQNFVTHYQQAVKDPKHIGAMIESVRTLSATAQDLDFNYPQPQPTQCPTP